MDLALSARFFEGIAEDMGPRALHHLVRRMVLREALDCLGERGIPVMPLKGALLADWVYEDPTERQVGDIDLLVPESAFREATAALAARGYRPEPPLQTHERTLRASGAPLPIDLHRALFSKGRFRLPTKDLFARGREDTRLYGAPAVLPDPYDLYAHLVGHAAIDRQTPIVRTGKDLAKLAARRSLDPRRCAAHLEFTGLARAARYALSALGPAAEFAARVLRHLRPDPVGAFLAGAQRAVTARSSPESIPSKLAGHLTDTSLSQLLHGVFESAAERLRFWRERREDLRRASHQAVHPL